MRRRSRREAAPHDGTGASGSDKGSSLLPLLYGVTCKHPTSNRLREGYTVAYLTLSKGAYLIDTLKGNSSPDGGENIKGVFPLCKGGQILNEAQEENSSKVVTGVYTTTIQEGKFSLLYFLL